VYYYFDFNEAGKNTPESLIRSLITQLLAKCTDIPENLLTLYSLSLEGQNAPPIEDLRQILRDLLQDNKEAFIIIDALDECLECGELLQLLSEIKSWGLANVRLIAASRQYFEDSSLMDDLDPVRLSVQDETANDDILVYIRERLEKDPKLKYWPPDLKAEIEKVLMNKACGMYDRGSSMYVIRI
jgi:hypothetical protein